MKQQPQKIIGSFEPVSFPEFKGAGTVRAKIDTGAYTGSLHCTKVRLEETKQDKILHFSPFDHPEVKIKTVDFSIRPVRSSNGVEQNRYFVNTHITIKGITYPITLSLADRSDMKWPVLIGRRFLRKNNFLVDVSQRNS